MVRAQYVCNSKLYKEHYGRGLPTFIGDVVQDGYGIGGVIASLFRGLVPLFSKSVVPVLKTTAKAAGRTMLRSGANIVKDVVLEKKKLGDSLKRQAVEGFDNFIDEMTQRQHRSQTGQGYPCKRRKKTKRIRVERDIFD